MKISGRIRAGWRIHGQKATNGDRLRQAEAKRLMGCIGSRVAMVVTFQANSGDANHSTMPAKFELYASSTSGQKGRGTRRCASVKEKSIWNTRK